MKTLKDVPIADICENPHRQLATYPTIEKKVEALMRSIQDVGLWEGLIARPSGDQFQLAFGHHRLEAARRLGLTSVSLIVRDLTDTEMVKFMGRENGEDYSTEFLVLLNTWEGAVSFLADRREKLQPIDVARLLGWVAVGTPEKHPQGLMSVCARACASAHALIAGGWMERENLTGLSVFAAREIVERAHSRIEQIDRSAAVTKAPAKLVEKAKAHVAKGAKVVAQDVREGRIAQKDIRSSVDVEGFKAAATSKVKDSPLFAVFSRAFVDQLDKLLKTDSASKKLDAIASQVNNVTMDVDRAVLRQVDFALTEVGVRADGWRKRLIPTSEKVVGLPKLEHKNA